MCAVAWLLVPTVYGQLVREANTSIDIQLVAGPPAAPTINGTLAGDEADYGAPRAVQDTQTGFGDNTDPGAANANGSELNAIYGVTGAGQLNLLVTGNLENTPNPYQKLFIFIDSAPGGQNRLLGGAGDGDVNRLGDDGSGNGLRFDAGFEANYVIKANGDASNYYFDLIDLGTGTKTFLGAIPPGGSDALGLGMLAAIDNSNTGGVTGGSGPGDGSGVTTGLEMRIPFDIIGNPVDPIRICLVLANPSVDIVANQTLGGLGGSPNLGEPRNVNFASMPGAQFVSIANAGGAGISYQLVDAFPGLSFTAPLDIVTPPGETNRLFVVERPGRISVITNLANPTVTTFLDIQSRVTGGASGNDERGLMGLAFHPDYAANGLFYVFYTGDATTGLGSGLHTILSRFNVAAGTPNQADPDSELRFIIQRNRANNHNSGALAFGPDGYLYVSLGDEGGANDNWNNSQRIDHNYFAGIIRIDVDMRPGNLLPNPHPASTTNYWVPADNPWVGATSFNGAAVDPANVRTEFYAVGLRNPWRINFDPLTGDLYCADVGQSAREEVNIIRKGGNYGWAFYEGTINGPKIAQAPPGFVQDPPILEYLHGTSEFRGRSITGGQVYRGDRYPELLGRYVFADFVSGHLWTLRYDGTTGTEWTRLLTEAGLVTFGVDPRNGDILVGSLPGNRIRRLVRNIGGDAGPLPPTLSDTGVFSDLEALTPHAGVVPYDINVPFWSDGTEKWRWFSVPELSDTIGFDPAGHWTFPEGTVWIKHFEIETITGVPESARRLETRILVKDEENVSGFTYRWGSSTTDATLVPEAGLDEMIVIDDAGVIRTQVWRYPGRSECILCHRASAGGALSFHTVQMNRDRIDGVVTQNQITALSAAGYFSEPVQNVNLLRALPALTNEFASIESRARAYLEANCAMCHRPSEGIGFFDSRVHTPLSQAGIVNGAINSDFGNPLNRLLVPGDPTHSMLLTRIASDGPGRMPPVSSSVVDTQGVALVTAWINQLSGYQTFEEFQLASFGSTNAPGTGPNEDFDGDGASNWLEWLTGTDADDDTDFWAIEGQLTNVAESGVPPVYTIRFERLANVGFEVQWTTSIVQNIWYPLDTPANRPFFISVDMLEEITDTDADAAEKFWRVRVYEP